MIKSGSTNQEIASRMGYSESLIRQETIIIYRKLGISGRRDLLIG
ncbi:MAG: Bacterial regulatory protein luxR family, partial [Actinomycetota bacterium]